MRGIKSSIGVAAAALAFMGSTAMAQQAETGTITRIDRLSNTIAIRQIPTGTVGTGNSAAAAKNYKVQSPGALENLHAGDRVSFSATQSGGVDTITKIEKKK